MHGRRRVTGLLRVVHPFPSLLNAGLVVALAVLADGRPIAVGLLGLGMLGLQFAIGAFNDYCDHQRDRLAKPAKPIPRGLISRRATLAAAVLSATVGLASAAVVGSVTLLLAAVMLAAGLAYDAWLKVRGFGWLAFAVAFPLLPVYAWYGAAGGPPPHWQLLLPVAALAGPMLHLANGLTDLEDDARTGVGSLAVRLGRRRGVLLLALLQLTVNGLAWLSLVGVGASGAEMAAVATAGVVSGLGLTLSAAGSPARRRHGWHVQALGLALLALAWLTVAAPRSG